MTSDIDWTQVDSLSLSELVTTAKAILNDSVMLLDGARIIFGITRELGLDKTP